MSSRPTDRGDQPDQAMPAARGRTAGVLSADQERLLDEWVAGRLVPEAAVRAEALAKQNTLAAERVLERRLLKAAGRRPPAPHDLAARAYVAKWRRPRGLWRWLGFAAAAALVAILVVAGLPLLQQAIRGRAPVQVAMVALGDRTPLLESSDIPAGSTAPAQGSPSDQRPGDVEVPTILLGNLLMAAAPPSQSAASHEIERYLPNFRADRGRTLHLVIDAALKQRVEAEPGRERMPVRIYDLEDPRAAEIRSAVGALPDGARVYLLTPKP